MTEKNIGKSTKMPAFSLNTGTMHTATNWDSFTINIIHIFELIILQEQQKLAAGKWQSTNGEKIN